MIPTVPLPSASSLTGRGLVQLLSRSGGSLTYSSLSTIRRRGYRTRAWARLDTCERGVFRCALWIAKARGKITNMKFMVQVIRVALRLLETVNSRIVKAGRERAAMMFLEYAKPGGVFSWAPRMRLWLNDPRYVRYLGLMEVNG